MSTSCCQISTPNRFVVSEYEVPNVFLRIKWGIFLVHPVLSVRSQTLAAKSTHEYSLLSNFDTQKMSSF